MLTGILIIVTAIGIDQFTKLWCLLNLEEGKPLVIIEDFFTFELAFNDGAAWSSFSGAFWFLMVMTVIATAFFIYLYKDVDFKTKKIYSISISLMLGGMLGNFIDRIFQEGNVVVDFLTFYIYGSNSAPFPHFNIADSCLVVGVVFFIIDVLFLESRRKNNV